ncbi:PRD domain-containing protein [Galactobacillus timonensis]|uniref:PRD domain-containing protein n=1 Tax=Galactobacillus timonensis TaxID=2041840 RepID=UPI000C838E38|nr:PRD domain-containing protein [Galactobacillus timonensis]
MKIEKILNTNAVIAQNEHHESILLLGSGLGFKKKPKENVDEDRVEKWFVLKEKSSVAQFEKIVESIPEDYIMAAEEIIEFGKRLNPDLKFSEHIHLSLVDHLYNAAENLKEGIVIPNTMLEDIANFYPREYSIGIEGLKIAKLRLGVEFPEDEAGFVAMHFVMAQQGNEHTNIRKMLQLVHELDQMIREDLDVDTNPESLAYFRYMTHLKFFAQRVVQNVHYNEQNLSDSVVNVLAMQYPEEYRVSKKVLRFVEQKYGYSGGKEENLYLAVHLARIRKH